VHANTKVSYTYYGAALHFLGRCVLKEGIAGAWLSADVCTMTSHIAQGTTKILFHEICLRMQQPKVCLSLKVYFAPEINQIALVYS